MLVKQGACLKKKSLQVKDIDLIVYDFDGVMTDNRVIVFQDGSEAVIANRADGLGVNYFKNCEVPQLILSTETNPVVKARAAKLEIEVIIACEDKRLALVEFCLMNNYDLGRVMYVGNDLNDLEVMKIVGYPIAPSNACLEIKKIAMLVTNASGGEGVIKELSDELK